MDSGSVSRRMCVAGRCSRKKADGISLHQFPFDRPAILRQWTAYVKNSRKNWTGPTSASVLCSVHFSPDSYPAKYRIMESMGVPVQRKELERDAVPTVKIQIPEEKTPFTGETKG
ncbi:THAP domain-containing protein 10-like [Saccostrea cucullata]|uniref:THAP domain-containing protein 10-like n=1 Tax=Saccostrea cuccullata TaxID=36930 RepID=UPI002ED5D7E4